jgi:hypothetical protein
MFNVKIDSTDIDRKTARMIRSLNNPGRCLSAWAQAVAKRARANAVKKSKGGTFWNEIAKDTRVRSISTDSFEVACDHPAGYHKHKGGKIRAKKARALTIPITDEAKGKRAKEFEHGGRNLFVFPNSNGVLGYSAGGKLHPLFVLRKVVTQKAEPWWPEASEINALGLKEAAYWLNREVLS